MRRFRDVGTWCLLTILGETRGGTAGGAEEFNPVLRPRIDYVSSTLISYV